jgi:hypothetical protein
MQQSILIDYVMTALWVTAGDGRTLVDKDDLPKEAVAIASYVKTHRVNTDNVFEVIRIMWPKAKLSVKRELGEWDKAETVLYDVTFPDKSQGLVASMDGIGTEYEVILG